MARASDLLQSIVVSSVHQSIQQPDDAAQGELDDLGSHHHKKKANGSNDYQPFDQNYCPPSTPLADGKAEYSWC
jgi:hypothetical protein